MAWELLCETECLYHMLDTLDGLQNSYSIAEAEYSTPVWEKKMLQVLYMGNKFRGREELLLNSIMKGGKCFWKDISIVKKIT